VTFIFGGLVYDISTLALKLREEFEMRETRTDGPMTCHFPIQLPFTCECGINSTILKFLKKADMLISS